MFLPNAATPIKRKQESENFSSVFKCLISRCTSLVKTSFGVCPHPYVVAQLNPRIGVYRVARHHTLKSYYCFFTLNIWTRQPDWSVTRLELRISRPTFQTRPPCPQRPHHLIQEGEKIPLPPLTLPDTRLRPLHGQGAVTFLHQPSPVEVTQATPSSHDPTNR